jgi:hypothetical protein
MESYYSVFQCYHLRYLLDAVTLEAKAEVWVVSVRFCKSG